MAHAGRRYGIRLEAHAGRATRKLNLRPDSKPASWFRFDPEFFLQQVVEVVSDASGQQSKAFELLSMLELTLELFPFRKISDIQLNGSPVSLGVDVTDELGLKPAAVFGLETQIGEPHSALISYLV